MEVAPAIGIDLGTTNSCAAVHDGKRPRVLRSSLGYATIPSVLTFVGDGVRAVVGQQAERQMVLRPADCIYGSKRLLGRAFSQAALQRFQPHFAYQLVGDEAGFVAARVCDKTVSLVAAAAHILKAIKSAAEDSLGKQVEQAVITVPAYFNENQRALVRRAGELADLNVLRVVNEPTAAALCYGVGRGEGQRVLVFDLGGGTFDVSIVELDGESYSVLGVDGDTFLGGLDFDRRLAQLVREKLSAQMGFEVQLDAVGNARLMLAVREAKHELSEQPHARVGIRSFSVGDQSLHVEELVTADEYLEACDDLLRKIREVVKRVMDRARLRPADIDEVLLVGGQTRMPAVQQLIRDLLHKEPSKRVHPDEVVALGAAIVAYSHAREDSAVLRDMLPVPLGTCSPDGHFQALFQRNTPLPAELKFELQAAPQGAGLRLPLFQGDGFHVLDNEFIGAMVIDELPGHGEPATLNVVLRLDEEGLLAASVGAPGGQERAVEVITNCSPNDLLGELRAASVRVSLSQAAPVARTPSAASKPAPQPTPLAPPAVGAASSARLQGSAKREAPSRSIWQRLFGWMRRG